MIYSYRISFNIDYKKILLLTSFIFWGDYQSPSTFDKIADYLGGLAWWKKGLALILKTSGLIFLIAFLNISLIIVGITAFFSLIALERMATEHYKAREEVLDIITKDIQALEKEVSEELVLLTNLEGALDKHIQTLKENNVLLQEKAEDLEKNNEKLSEQISEFEAEIENFKNIIERFKEPVCDKVPPITQALLDKEQEMLDKAEDILAKVNSNLGSKNPHNSSIVENAKKLIANHTQGFFRTLEKESEDLSNLEKGITS